MKRVWILGIGPLMVSSQFIQDVPRLDMFLFGRPLSKNIFDALEVLYKAFGSDYFFYTNYANQYMGNKTYDRIKSDNHLVCNTINIYIERNKIEACIVFDVYDKTLRWIKNIRCRSVKTKDDFLIYL